MLNRVLSVIRWCLIYSLGVFPALVLAEVSLPALISDNMVLQQKTQAHIWGWAEPGERVKLSIADHELSVATDQQGSWSIYLPHLPAGHYTLKIQGQTVGGKLSDLTVNNVVVGEVWLASGQSNMAWPVSKSAQAGQAIANAQHPEIRFFKVTRNTALTPLQDVAGYWEVLTPETVGEVSGVAYYFARKVQQELAVPVGIIEADWNNTKIQAWTGLSALEAEPALEPLLADMHYQLNLPAAEKQVIENKMLAWEAGNYLADPGISPEAEAFAAPDYDDAQWKTVNLPETLGALGFKGDGAVWFRREIILPDSWSGEPAQLDLGMIDDFDIAYVNGVMVGTTTREQPFHWLYARRYSIPEGVLQTGRNTIQVRVFDQFGDGGFTSRARTMKLETGSESLPLSGNWKYHFSYQAPAKRADFASIPQPPYGLKNRNTPGVLYNAMIAPLQAYTLQGVVWYQGESDVHNTEQYRTIFPAMIRQWREGWQQRLPFVFVQLANFEFNARAKRQKWAEMRAVQADAAASVPGLGMVTAIDVGESDNVHPKDKRTVGQRLANWVLARVYGVDAAYQGPEYEYFTPEKTDSGQARLRLSFGAADGLYAKGNISAFELAGVDGVYHQATATIEGQAILLQAEGVVPVSLRYAWRDNPIANVFNGEGLPLKPFMAELMD